MIQSRVEAVQIPSYRGFLPRSRPASPWDSREPVREELFSAERIEEHARSLAAAQRVTSKLTKGHPLASRLADNGSTLLDCYRSVVRAINDGRAITPAAEWLVDNYHLIERQIRQLRLDLPRGYYRQLPKLSAGPFAGYPRVFGLAWAFVAHTDSRFDIDMLIGYVRAYQEVQPLTIGELWAVSITLRIVLIENLRRLATQIALGSLARKQADGLADRLLGVTGRAPEPVSAVLANPRIEGLADAFAVQLVHRLRDQDPSITPALTWLDQFLATLKITADDAVRDVHRRQGAANVTVRNIITSLRLISDVDWQKLFESLSLVDDVLAADSSFAAMDFPTRNLYRSEIEELARGSNRLEIEIARSAIRAGTRVEPLCPETEQTRQRDPGYHLLGGGRLAFEAEIGFHAPLSDRPARLARALGIGGYATAIVGVAAVLLAAALLATGSAGAGGLLLLLFGFLGVIPALDAAIAMVNRAVTSCFRAALLPALELRGGVPPICARSSRRRRC